MSDFLQELQEDARQENLMNFWRQYGLWIILAIVLFLIGTAAYLGWSAYQKSVAESESAQYQQALDLLHSHQTDEAEKILKNLEKNAYGYGFLAKLQQFSLMSKRFTASPSDKTWQQLTSQSQAFLTAYPNDLGLKGVLATHMAFTLLKTKDSTQSLEQHLIQHLTPQHPWKGLALEALFLQAVQTQHMEAALNALNQALYQRDIPRNLQTRLGLEAIGAGLEIPLPPQKHK